MITSNNVFRHELIGLYLEVVDSSNKSLIGLCGKVVNETMKTFSIEISSKVNTKMDEKIVPKKDSIFHFKITDDDWVEIEGKYLVSRPEDRIKKKFRKI
jgi:ribonuclease P protein subunit POP4